MKKSTVVWIIVICVIALVLVGILLGGFFLRHMLLPQVAQIVQNQNHDSIEASKGAVSAQLIQELEVQWVAGTVTILPGDTEEITFSEDDSTNNPMTWKVIGDRLVIQFCKDQWNISPKTDDVYKELVITVPKSWSANSVQIQAVSAEVFIDQITTRELDFDGVSGKCELTDCSVRELEINTASGNVLFSGNADQVECSGVSANCTLEMTNTPREISIEGVSGNLDLTLPEDTGFVVERDSVSGQFHSDFDAVGSRGNYRYGNGSCKIEVEGLSGNVTIRKAAA